MTEIEESKVDDLGQNQESKYPIGIEEESKE